MFDNLQDKMDRVFKTLRGEATLNEWHIDNALKEIRVALLEADVHFKTVKEFTARVREKAVGGDVLTAFSPAQQVTKIVRDELQELLGGNEVGLALVGSPSVIMMSACRARARRPPRASWRCTSRAAAAVRCSFRVTSTAPRPSISCASWPTTSRCRSTRSARTAIRSRSPARR